MLFLTDLLLLFVAFGNVTADCVQGFIAKGERHPIQVVAPRQPKRWHQMMNACAREASDQGLMTLHSNWTERDRTSCGDVLVPVFLNVEVDDVPASGNRDLTIHELQMRDTSYPKLPVGVGAFNLTSGLWHFVDEDFRFTCAICDMTLTEQLHLLTSSENELLFFEGDLYMIQLVSLGEHKSEATVTIEDKKEIKKELTTLFTPPLNYVIIHDFIFKKVYLNEDKKLVLILHCKSEYNPDEIDVERYWKTFQDVKRVQQMKMLKNFWVHVENITDCSEEKVKGQENRTIVLPQGEYASIHLSWDSPTNIVTRYVCAFNFTLQKHSWLTPTLWEVEWMPCTSEDKEPNDEYYHSYFNGGNRQELSYLLVSICMYLNLVIIL